MSYLDYYHVGRSLCRVCSSAYQASIYFYWPNLFEKLTWQNPPLCGDGAQSKLHKSDLYDEVLFQKSILEKLSNPSCSIPTGIKSQIRKISNLGQKSNGAVPRSQEPDLFYGRNFRVHMPDRLEKQMKASKKEKLM